MLQEGTSGVYLYAKFEVLTTMQSPVSLPNLEIGYFYAFMHATTT